MYYIMHMYWQARAAYSIAETRSRMTGGEAGVLARGKEVELEASFFAQVQTFEKQIKNSDFENTAKIV